MNNFQKIADGIDTVPALLALKQNADLWDKRKWRTTYVGTPHGDVSDIWLRFNDEEVTAAASVDPTKMDDKQEWYPEWHLFPQLRPMIFGLMNRVNAYELGRLVITRLKPGGRILPHADTMGDYANSEDGARYHIVLQGLPGSLFRAGDETVNMLTGEVWWFNHLAEHEVVNNSADDRIHLLIDTRNA